MAGEGSLGTVPGARGGDKRGRDTSPLSGFSDGSKRSRKDSVDSDDGRFSGGMSSPEELEPDNGKQENCRVGSSKPDALILNSVVNALILLQGEEIIKKILVSSKFVIIPTRSSCTDFAYSTYILGCPI